MTYGELKARALFHASELGVPTVQTSESTYGAFFLEGFKAFYFFVWPEWGSGSTTLASTTSTIDLDTVGIASPSYVELAGVMLLDRGGYPGPVPITHIPPTPATGTPTEWAIASPGTIYFDAKPASGLAVKVTGWKQAHAIVDDTTTLTLADQWLDILARWMALWITQSTRLGSAQDVGARMDAELAATIARLSPQEGKGLSPFLRMRGEK